MSFPNPAGIPVNESVLFSDFGIVDENEITSTEIRFVGTMGAIFFLQFDGGAGKYRIDIRVFGETWTEIAEGSVFDGDLLAIPIDFFVPRARLRFEADVGATFPGTLNVAAHGYPAVFVR